LAARRRHGRRLRIIVEAERIAGGAARRAGDDSGRRFRRVRRGGARGIHRRRAAGPARRFLRLDDLLAILAAHWLGQPVGRNAKNVAAKRALGLNHLRHEAIPIPRGRRVTLYRRYSTPYGSCTEGGVRGQESGIRSLESGIRGPLRSVSRYL